MRFHLTAESSSSMKSIVKTNFKQMKNHVLILVLVVSSIIITSCKEEKKEETKTISLTATSDGYIINSSPRIISQYYDGSCGYNIQVGWTSSGYAVRGFISFDISSILPQENEILTINKAELKVYECNTNLQPFDGDNSTRYVEAYLVNYGALDVNDFDLDEISYCGTLATWGYNVLKEYPLDIISSLETFFNSEPEDVSSIQFRIQFTDDNNITDTNNSDLDGSSWQFFAQENNNEYQPVLEIEYTIKEE